MRLRTRTCVKSAERGPSHPRRRSRLSLNAGPPTADIRQRLRSFNENCTVRTPIQMTALNTKRISPSSLSDQENQDILAEHILHAPSKPLVKLTPIFSPRRFRSVSKDQAAKLKRLNTRKIEFDANVCPELYGFNLSVSADESVLNQSLVGGDPKERLLELCGQNNVRPFSSFLDPETLTDIVKIGEGVYGEVFLSTRGTVIKIFPIDGDLPVNGEKQMDCHKVYPEVFISKQLTQLGFKYRRNKSVNFIQLRRASVVSGKWPVELTVAWKVYESEKGSDNECLDFLPASQEWMLLEFDYAGTPLGTFKFNSYREARSVIEQIALSLAAAESALQFEHRDLHWLNVLVKPTKQQKLRYRVDGVSYAVQTEGVQICIIDFTVSRLCHEGNVVYVDMSTSPEIFDCEGDYQFEIYRMMRKMNGNNWRPFRPVTNLYWLHYLMAKLLHETSYPRRDPDCSAVQSELTALHDSVLSGKYGSACQLVGSNFYFDPCRID